MSAKRSGSNCLAGFVTPAKPGIQRGRVAGYPFPLGGKVRMGERPPSTSRVIP